MPEKCPCKGDYLDKLIQPSILALLCEGPAYGLELLHELDRRGLANGADSAGFYRALKKLEETGKLASCWQTGRSGRPRRVYVLTDAGRRCLENWQHTLLAYMEDVRRVSNAVNAACALTNNAKN
ncbi:MAG TPA: helix-turn-helix transcriptional regulator [Candidatus Scatomorpha gallistercoris]|nr:helix-turn-helix transcriptional regulator [Candidatus Scatomorpha gallistercoris]